MLRHPEKLRGVHPNLVLLMETVGQARDLVVLEGARSVADELEAIRSGHSTLTDPMDSKHVIDPEKRPLALAVDVAPDPVDWTNLDAFKALGAVVLATARDMGIPVTWGGDWLSFKDYPHYQLEG